MHVSGDIYIIVWNENRIKTEWGMKTFLIETNAEKRERDVGEKSIKKSNDNLNWIGSRLSLISSTSSTLFNTEDCE